MKLMSFGAQNLLDKEEVWTPLSSGGGGLTFLTKTGIRVNPDNALGVAAFYAAVRVITDTLSMLPLFIYRRRRDGGKERDTSHYLHELLFVQPNPWQTSMEWISMMTGHALMRGNGYSRIVQGPRGFVDQLVPLNPTRTMPRLLDNGELVYEVMDQKGNKEVLPKSEVFHLRSFGDGIQGIPLLGLMRETLGLAMAAEIYGNRFFKHAGAPSGVFQHPSTLSDPAQERLVHNFNRTYGGADNAFKVMVLEEGMQWHQVGMNHEDAQLLETRKFTVTEIARWFRIPPHLIGDLERSTFSNIEHQALEFVQYSLLPWVRLWEKTILRDLIIDQRQNFAEFTVDALLRGDTKSRFESYQVAIQNGIMSANEVRSLENLNPRAGGDKFMTPLNMQLVEGRKADIEALAKRTSAAVVGAIRSELGDNGMATPDNSATEVSVSAMRDKEEERLAKLVEGQAERLVRKEIAWVKQWSVRLASEPEQWEQSVHKFYGEHAQLVAETLAVDEADAKKYCDQQVVRLLAEGVGIVEDWLKTRKEALMALAA